MNSEMAIALGLDFITGARANLSVVGGEAHETMDITFHEEQAAPETPIITISRGSTLEPIKSGEGPSLPSQTLSFGGDFDSHFKGV